MKFYSKAGLIELIKLTYFSDKVNEARLQLFSSHFGVNSDLENFKKKSNNYDASKLPPSDRELQQQINRSVYISSMWSNATLSCPTNLSPTEYGWVLIDNNYEFNWFEGDETPNLVQDTIPESNSDEGKLL